MWPWGHLAVGYVVFSVCVRLGLRRPPSERGVLVLAVATQLPDLIDKPLGWQFGLLNGGVGVAHSLLVGVPLALVLGALLVYDGKPEFGGALSVGVGTHVAGDLLFRALFGGRPLVSPFLWPLYEGPAVPPPGFGQRLGELLAKSVALLGSPLGKVYVALEVLLLVGTLLLWVLDGTPGTRTWRSLTRRRDGPRS